MDWAEASRGSIRVGEEIDEARAALALGDREHAAEEMGDAMLALANAPRFVGHDAERRCGALAKSSPSASRRSSASPPRAELELVDARRTQIEVIGRKPSARLTPTSVEPA